MDGDREPEWEEGDRKNIQVSPPLSESLTCLMWCFIFLSIFFKCFDIYVQLNFR